MLKHMMPNGGLERQKFGHLFVVYFAYSLGFSFKWWARDTERYIHAKLALLFCLQKYKINRPNINRKQIYLLKGISNPRTKTSICCNLLDLTWSGCNNFLFFSTFSAKTEKQLLILSAFQCSCNFLWTELICWKYHWLSQLSLWTIEHLLSM